ncbi:MAG: helix-turn-helix transcriptional regulator [Elusimicrobia bacterium]|nr:helix-turn-helix transcriptional regulator [Elusimicrobiota bacterium]
MKPNKNKQREEMSPVHRDTLKRIEEDPEFAEAYFEELRSSPIPVQLALLRRLKGIPQVEVAAKLHLKQAFISKLEKPESDHRISIVSKVAKALNGELVILPPGARVIFARV